MIPKSTLRALLLIVVALPTFACQFLRPAPQSCRVDMPVTGWESHRTGDQVTFKVDAMEWKAQVDCRTGHLVDGQPVKPERAKEIFIPIEDSTYRLFTSDPRVTMIEHRENGSHVQIDINGGRYLVVLSASPAALGSAAIKYFMAGETPSGLVHLYCYDRTEGEEHIALPGVAAVWTVDKPTTISLICSGRNFVLEVSTQVTQTLLNQGPTPVPPTPGPTLTPQPPGSHL